jgi:hypothetical protein
MNWEEEARRAEERYAAAQADLLRFERRMGIIMVACGSLAMTALIGLSVLQVLQ